MSDNTPPEKLPSLAISQMIASEDDPKQRASLLVMFSISSSLEAITSTIKEMQLKVDTHMEKEEVLLNKGRGAWWVLAPLILAANSYVIYLGKAGMEEIAAIRTAIQTSVISDMKLESRINLLDAKISVIESKK